MSKNKIIYKKSPGEIVSQLFFIVLGNLICSIAFNVFFSPQKMLSGGVGGISLMVQYLTDIPSGITMLAINIPILIIGFKMVDKDFAINSLISIFIFSGLLTLTKDLSGILEINDPIVAAIAGGALNGLGMGILFRNRSSQGGLDIIATFLKRKYNINISSGLMMFNMLIITISSFLFTFEPAVYTLISMYIAYQVLDRVQLGLNIKKNVTIISDKYEEIGEAIMDEMGRSITYLEAMGGYKKEEKLMIYTVVVSKQIANLKEIVERIDSSALITISDIVEVEGSTFEKKGI